ncbi:MAG: four helix bundle protein [Thermodesulfovibrionales bacterium]
MGYQNFKELKVWQEAKVLAVDIYKLTAQGKFSKDFGLKEQIQRSSVSIASNIAEGYECNSDKDFIRFLMIAKGSLGELRTQLEIAKEIDYIDENLFNDFESRCNKIGAMLTKLIQSRRNSS